MCLVLFVYVLVIVIYELFDAELVYYLLCTLFYCSQMSEKSSLAAQTAFPDTLFEDNTKERLRKLFGFT
jgi:hypothetical protein